ncbi:SRPBCC family protein [Sphingobacterium corticibacterium]|uniref:Polyketide cyclase n=1 Tax=Sphingobacterium corticibacterium TaxID=2484746 RepID=A0A4Q6XS05_9SPHI|nr:polyketide cyclase [Sphingobacterium corticibacterium]RZF62545.1 polyketide cyclase [Sphingobacterium corticibacterium]
MKKILKDKSFQLSILLTLIFLGTGITFLLLGLAHYSWVIFILLPVVLGVALGAMPNKKYILWGALITTAIVLICLVIPGLSGLLCIVMTLPIVVPLIFLGHIITHLVRRYGQIKDTNRLSVLLLPLVPFFIAAPVEQFLKTDNEVINEVRTEQVFNYTPEQVYDAIKSVDTLDAKKPYLMYFDLPIPTKCVLEKEEVGGLRICYFKAGESSTHDFGSGKIIEKITKMERGKVLKMDVIDYKLVGRNWLGFKEAIYYFDKVGDNSCKLTRITTYTSVLTPRLYWQPLEELGIEQEHEYVFNNLTNDLERMYGQ